MYSEFDNLIINLARYGFAFTIVYVLWPRLLFKDSAGGLDGFVSRYVKMVCLTVALGYVLVLIKLYEWLSFVTILLMLSVYSKFVQGKGKGHIKEVGATIASRVYDFFDGLVNPVKLFAEWYRETIRSLQRIINYRFNSFVAAGNTLLFTAVILYSVYLRFYDAIVHAAPAMSDAYVTLAWMKYIEDRILFHDGIYPQGYHIYLSILRKFAANNALYVMKYTGPLNGVLTTLGVYFAVSRFTGRVVPGIISAFSYGVLGAYMHVEWERQAAANSQEFALVFLLPALYYAANYLKSRNKADFWAAAACFTVIGWVHTIVFVFLGIGVFFLLVAYSILRFKDSLKPAWEICLAVVTAGVLSVLPVLFGLLLGRSFHGSSAEFLTDKMTVTFPDITVIDQIALVGFVLFIIISIFRKQNKRDLVLETFCVLLGIASFVMYISLGPLTGSAVLATRMSILWSLVAPIGIGVGWYAIFRLARGNKQKQIAEILLCTVVLACAVAYLKPTPAQPYKMQYDSMVEQYLRINEEFRPTEWMIVSQEEGYALVLGRGWHMMLGDFLRWYNPEDRYLTRRFSDRIDILDTPDIFIFTEKRMFRANFKEMEPILARREKEYRMLDQWFEIYRATHNDMSIYYEDANIKVMHIQQPKTIEKYIK